VRSVAVCRGRVARACGADAHDFRLLLRMMFYQCALRRIHAISQGEFSRSPPPGGHCGGGRAVMIHCPFISSRITEQKRSCCSPERLRPLGAAAGLRRVGKRTRRSLGAEFAQDVEDELRGQSGGTNRVALERYRQNYNLLNI
jgi:hypothetical protein